MLFRICSIPITKNIHRGFAVITITNVHREGKMEMFTVQDGPEHYRVAVMVDLRCDGIKIPIINGVEDRTQSRLIGIHQIQRLRDSVKKAE